jgi:hypothetical protein
MDPFTKLADVISARVPWYQDALRQLRERAKSPETPKEELVSLVMQGFGEAVGENPALERLFAEDPTLRGRLQAAGRLLEDLREIEQVLKQCEEIERLLREDDINITTAGTEPL